MSRIQRSRTTELPFSKDVSNFNRNKKIGRVWNSGMERSEQCAWLNHRGCYLRNSSLPQTYSVSRVLSTVLDTKLVPNKHASNGYKRELIQDSGGNSWFLSCTWLICIFTSHCILCDPIKLKGGRDNFERDVRKWNKKNVITKCNHFMLLAFDRINILLYVNCSVFSFICA